VAVHKAAYLGDADSSGIHSAADAFLVVQAAVGLASGFFAHAWTDPRIVGDADGFGVLSAADAFLNSLWRWARSVWSLTVASAEAARSPVSWIASWIFSKAA